MDDGGTSGVQYMRGIYSKVAKTEISTGPKWKSFPRSFCVQLGKVKGQTKLRVETELNEGRFAV